MFQRLKTYFRAANEWRRARLCDIGAAWAAHSPTEKKHKSIICEHTGTKERVALIKWHLKRREHCTFGASPFRSAAACICRHFGSQIVESRTLPKTPQEKVIWFSTHLILRIRVEDALSTQSRHFGSQIVESRTLPKTPKKR